MARYSGPYRPAHRPYHERRGHWPRGLRLLEESGIERGFVLIYSDPSRRAVSHPSAAETRHRSDAGRRTMDAEYCPHAPGGVEETPGTAGHPFNVLRTA